MLANVNYRTATITSNYYKLYTQLTKPHYILVKSRTLELRTTAEFGCVVLFLSVFSLLLW